MEIPKDVLRLIMRYRLEMMILDESIMFEHYNPERTRAGLWIVDWYYSVNKKGFTDPYGLYISGSVVWKYILGSRPLYLYDIENLD